MRIRVDEKEMLKDNVTGIWRFLLNFLKYAPQIKPVRNLKQKLSLKDQLL